VCVHARELMHCCGPGCLHIRLHTAAGVRKQIWTVHEFAPFCLGERGGDEEGPAFAREGT